MGPLMAFPDFQRQYESPELFPLFKNRVISPSRRDFPEYLSWLDLDSAHSDPIAMLAVTGGERTTDNLEVFPKVEKNAEGNFKVRFFLHGMRHVCAAAKERSSHLKEGEALRVMVEMDNPVTRLALALHTDDYQMIGWAPRYLVRDIMESISKSPMLAAHVVKINEGPAPLNRRVLVEMSGQANDGFDPMTTPDFRPLILE
jgi:hypothetical protein